ncbi:duf28 domain containing protein [Grosmannia clavigera kw1407]|uniref:Duf28 domain containing protein n=1 Tax=Grosmannia clavigera (strain kw1407 / UAMH 11150) TaxID=655863 RepID=F0XU95_GROCL|nr:duf28 domain containing protein [Grosmannia clavigera kw1407]EFW98469.1 duf28 domain containing protein [Grosmannia clavigera kw1407]
MSTAAATSVMASFRSGSMAPWTRLACMQCCRAFSHSPALASGHNRWSKIKHEKGAADAKRNLLRSGFSKNLTLYSQLYGSDLGSNPQLATTVAAAKKAGVPKATIEAAIARGQGRSADGARLEIITYEIMMPPSVAVLVELETESKARAMQDLNTLVRRKGGTGTPTKFFFSRRGRVVLGSDADPDAADPADAPPPDVSADDLLDDAIEAGAEDVETDEDGNIVIWTLANQTSAIVSKVAPKFSLATLSAETIWTPNEDTLSPVGEGDELRRLTELVTTLRTYPDVRAVYANVAQGEASDESFQQIAQELDW